MVLDGVGWYYMVSNGIKLGYWIVLNGIELFERIVGCLKVF